MACGGGRDDGVHAAELVLGRVEHRAHGVAVAHIALDGDGTPPGSFDLGHHLGRLVRVGGEVDHHRPVIARESPGACPTDPPRATCHDRYPCVMRCHGPPRIGGVRAHSPPPNAVVISVSARLLRASAVLSARRDAGTRWSSARASVIAATSSV